MKPVAEAVREVPYAQVADEHFTGSGCSTEAFRSVWGIDGYNPHQTRGWYFAKAIQEESPED